MERGWLFTLDAQLSSKAALTSFLVPSGEAEVRTNSPGSVLLALLRFGGIMYYFRGRSTYVLVVGSGAEWRLVFEARKPSLG